jgi:hypothetical protein
LLFFSFLFSFERLRQKFCCCRCCCACSVHEHCIRMFLPTRLMIGPRSEDFVGWFSCLAFICSRRTGEGMVSYRNHSPLSEKPSRFPLSPSRI